MELEPNSLDWNGDELERKHKLEDMNLCDDGCLVISNL